VAEFCCCKSGGLYDMCCGLYLSGNMIPDTPERLMRSRYAAFFHGNVDYLVATRDPCKSQLNERQALADTINHTQWLGLVVLDAPDPDINKGTGFVEFAAFHEDREGGVAQLHEKSKFVLKNDRWYYSTGTILPPIEPGRNSPCFCGGSKKYKKCHGK
jgi:SEC-C motif-containing protein